jgi:TctA family transporter
MGFHLAPAVLGIVLGPIMELALRSALILSQGSWMTFIQEPISASLLVALFLLLTSKYLLRGFKLFGRRFMQKGKS